MLAALVELTVQEAHPEASTDFLVALSRSLVFLWVVSQKPRSLPKEELPFEFPSPEELLMSFFSANILFSFLEKFDAETILASKMVGLTEIFAFFLRTLPDNKILEFIIAQSDKLASAHSSSADETLVSINLALSTLILILREFTEEEMSEISKWDFLLKHFQSLLGQDPSLRSLKIVAASVFQFGRILKPSNSALDFLWKILVPKLPSMSFASLSVFETALRSDVVRFDLVDINDFDASNTDQNLFQYFIAALYNTASILKKSPRGTFELNSLYANVMRKMSSAFIEDKPQGALQLSSLFIFLDSNFKDKQGEAVQKLIECLEFCSEFSGQSFLVRSSALECVFDVLRYVRSAPTSIDLIAPLVELVNTWIAVILNEAKDLFAGRPIGSYPKAGKVADPKKPRTEDAKPTTPKSDLKAIVISALRLISSVFAPPMVRESNPKTFLFLMSDLISEAISNSNDDDIAAQGLHTANAIAEFYSDKVSKRDPEAPALYAYLTRAVLSPLEAMVSKLSIGEALRFQAIDHLISVTEKISKTDATFTKNWKYYVMLFAHRSPNLQSLHALLSRLILSPSCTKEMVQVSFGHYLQCFFHTLPSASPLYALGVTFKSIAKQSANYSNAAANSPEIELFQNIPEVDLANWDKRNDVFFDLCRFLREAQWSVLNEALKDAFGQLIPSLNRHLAMLAKQKLEGKAWKASVITCLSCLVLYCPNLVQGVDALPSIVSCLQNKLLGSTEKSVMSMILALASLPRDKDPDIQDLLSSSLAFAIANYPQLSANLIVKAQISSIAPPMKPEVIHEIIVDLKSFFLYAALANSIKGSSESAAKALKFLRQRFVIKEFSSSIEIAAVLNVIMNDEKLFSSESSTASILRYRIEVTGFLLFLYELFLGTAHDLAPMFIQKPQNPPDQSFIKNLLPSHEFVKFVLRVVAKFLLLTLHSPVPAAIAGLVSKVNEGLQFHLMNLNERLRGLFARVSLPPILTKVDMFQKIESDKDEVNPEVIVDKAFTLCSTLIACNASLTNVIAEVLPLLSPIIFSKSNSRKIGSDRYIKFLSQSMGPLGTQELLNADNYD